MSGWLQKAHGIWMIHHFNASSPSRHNLSCLIPTDLLQVNVPTPVRMRFVIFLTASVQHMELCCTIPICDLAVNWIAIKSFTWPRCRTHHPFRNCIAKFHMLGGFHWLLYFYLGKYNQWIKILKETHWVIDSKKKSLLPDFWGPCTFCCPSPEGILVCTFDAD